MRVKKPTIATRAEEAARKVTEGLPRDGGLQRIRDYFYVGWMRGYAAAQRDARKGNTKGGAL